MSAVTTVLQSPTPKTIENLGGHCEVSHHTIATVLKPFCEIIDICAPILQQARATLGPEYKPPSEVTFVLPSDMPSNERRQLKDRIVHYRGSLQYVSLHRCSLPLHEGGELQMNVTSFTDAEHASKTPCSSVSIQHPNGDTSGLMRICSGSRFGYVDITANTPCEAARLLKEYNANCYQPGALLRCITPRGHIVLQIAAGLTALALFTLWQRCIAAPRT